MIYPPAGLGSGTTTTTALRNVSSRFLATLPIFLLLSFSFCVWVSSASIRFIFSKTEEEVKQFFFRDKKKKSKLFSPYPGRCYVTKKREILLCVSTELGSHTLYRGRARLYYDIITFQFDVRQLGAGYMENIFQKDKKKKKKKGKFLGSRYALVILLFKKKTLLFCVCL